MAARNRSAKARAAVAARNRSPEARAAARSRIRRQWRRASFRKAVAAAAAGVIAAVNVRVGERPRAADGRFVSAVVAPAGRERGVRVVELAGLPRLRVHVDAALVWLAMGAPPERAATLMRAEWGGRP